MPKTPTYQKYVIWHGRTWNVCRASMSLPLTFPFISVSSQEGNPTTRERAASGSTSCKPTPRTSMTSLSLIQAKARILNDALQDIGIGKYQASPCFHSFPLHAPRLSSPWCVRSWLIDPESVSGFCSLSLALVGYRGCSRLSSDWVADISEQPVITFGRWVQLGTVVTVIADRRRLML
jgi:hypothetical protein